MSIIFMSSNIVEHFIIVIHVKYIESILKNLISFFPEEHKNRYCLNKILRIIQHINRLSINLNIVGYLERNQVSAVLPVLSNLTLMIQ